MENSEFLSGVTKSVLYANPVDIESSKGGFNRLFKAKREGKFFIFKALKVEYRDNPRYESLLRKEFEIGFSLDSVHIARTYSFDTMEECGNVIVQEWVDGRTLSDYIGERRHSFAELKRVILQLCDALGYAHSKQVIHRDIKPQNILITYNGDNVKLIDFGLSDTDFHSELKEPAGSRRYASPELLSGEKIDNRSDIYSLGVVIDQMFGGKQPRKIFRITKKCCKYNRDDRYKNCQELSAELTSRSGFTFLYLLIALALLAAGVLVVQNNSATTSDIKDETAEEIVTEIEPVTENQIEVVAEVENQTEVVADDKIVSEPEDELELSLMVPTLDEENYPEKYIKLSNEYKSTISERSKHFYLSVDPLAPIPDFANDSVEYIAADRKSMDSVFNTELLRQSLGYRLIADQLIATELFAMYHRDYISKFFRSAENLLRLSEDEIADSIRRSAPKIVDNRSNELYGAERERADTEYQRSRKDSRKASVIPYILYRREQLGLPPLPQEFLNHYN